MVWCDVNDHMKFQHLASGCGTCIKKFTKHFTYSFTSYKYQGIWMDVTKCRFSVNCPYAFSKDDNFAHILDRNG